MANGQVKSSQVNFVIEPIFLRLIQENEANQSEYIRRLIMEDLTRRGLITVDVIMEMLGV